MPIYEYQCKKCRKTFDYMQKFSDPPKAKCEACGGKLEKQMSASGFILKGGGWYKDLYASPKPGSQTESSAKSEAKSEAKAEAKSEAKAEAKSEAKPAKKKAKAE